MQKNSRTSSAAKDMKKPAEENKIYVTGDTHRMQEIERFYHSPYVFRTNLTKSDYVIILGDFGVIWHDPDLFGHDKDILKVYERFPWTTLFIDGNHENHPKLNSYPEEIWNGGKIHLITDHVIHLMRGQVFTIYNTRIFTMGGATSTDKMYRQEGKTWWKEETPSKEETEEAIRQLESNDFRVDYILTHDAGTDTIANMGVAKYLLDENDPVQSFLNTLDTTLPIQYKHWYFGHHHIDQRIDTKHTAVFRETIRIK